MVVQSTDLPVVLKRKGSHLIWTCRTSQTTETDQALSEDQSYHETVRRTRSFMGWTHMPDMDSSSAEDNPFAAPKYQPLGKISAKPMSGSAKNGQI